MTSCCDTAQIPAERAPCPTCHASGKPVDIITVKGLLREAAMARIDAGQHYFCAASHCDVVYFDAGGRLYGTADMRVRVGEKEPAGGRTLCYCFGENEPGIRRELEERGESAAAARIRAHIKAGRCACEIRNPRGACCLGDVIAATDRMRRIVTEAAP